MYKNNVSLFISSESHFAYNKYILSIKLGPSSVSVPYNNFLVNLMKNKCFFFLIREEPNTIIYYSKRVAFCYNLHTLR